ncbi:hypothetical protein POM88_021150 [Heracleum sosnowskyi]|uniref:Leucine-rich repeat-containing N-terminal plant-type domain-containing protein n=1 Tax=Heracleum sosnowskyi TaxID=360622 RepID=A0AAD8MNQ4_9APIA|nr:hypothetical protein POM88_021150 [Heracleum sosnowskyi]
MKIQIFTSLLSILLLQIFSGSDIVLVSSQCHADQKSLLLQFKNSLHFNSTLSTKLAHWNQSTDCCDWEGVTCDISNNTGHVTGLDINSESVSSCLLSSTSSSLSGFRYLQRLNLAYNNFNASQFPAGISSLTNLTYLNLSTAGFSGKFPSSIANLTQLVYLDFWTNNFSGTISSTRFQNLVNLEYIDLGLNLLNGTIPSSLFALPSLRKLFLSYNDFHGKLPDFRNTESSHLNTFYASWNNLSGPIPISLFDLKSLGSSSLSHNKLSGDIQLQKLHRFKNLTYINFSFNNLSVESRHDNSSIFLPPMLKELKMASCRIQHFPDLRHLPSLVTVDLAENQISGDIPSWIWNVGNGGIQYLNLSLNQLEKLQEPYVIHNVSWIDLRSNNLRGNIPVPPKNVLFADYSDNFFNSTIPANINLTSAIFFAVSSNILSGTIPVSVCSAPNLKFLDLSNNYLVGSIPSCIFEFGETLGVLRLGNNSLTGNISGNFGNDCGNLSQNFPAWKAMKDGRNVVNILGFEFQSFGNSRKNYEDAVTISIKGKQLELEKILNIFTSIDISNNRFEGNIPHTMGDISFLEVLDLSYNELSGKIPTGSQIQTFPETSFEGNKRLCGPPLHINCSGVPVITPYYDDEDPGDNIKWEFVAPEVGFAVGLGIVILPLIFNKRWRLFLSVEASDVLMSSRRYLCGQIQGDGLGVGILFMRGQSSKH